MKRFTDGMVVPPLGAPGPGRALALLSSHGDEAAKAAVAATVASDAVAGAYSFGKGSRNGGGSRYAPY